MIDPVLYVPAAESGKDQWSEAAGVPLPSAEKISEYYYKWTLPDGMYDLCFDVLDLWSVETADFAGRVNAMFMLAAVFAAGYDYARLVQTRKGGGAG